MVSVLGLVWFGLLFRELVSGVALVALRGFMLWWLAYRF